MNLRTASLISEGFAKAGMAALTIVLATSLLAISAAAQDPEMFAQQACQRALQQKMRQESNARNPDATLDYRRIQTRQISNFETGLRGTGNFTRDANDRNREFSFNCVVNIRDGSVSTADYSWRGGGWNRESDQGYDNQSYGRNYGPRGRVWFSGGIINRASGKGLDVANRSTREAANVQQWTFADQPNQKWDVIDLGGGEYSIISQSSGKALDVANESGADGANVQQYSFHNGDNQRWRLQRTGGGYYQIINVGSGKCLDVASKSTAEGANIQQWSCSGAGNQAWKFGQ